MRRVQAAFDEQRLRGPADPNEFRRLVSENDTLRRRIAAMEEDGVEEVGVGEKVGLLIFMSALFATDLE